MRKLYTTKATTSNYSAKLVLFAILLILCAYNSYSQVTVPFTPRTATTTPLKTIYTVKGDFSMIGNTNLTLASYNDNIGNNHDMVFVDVDNDPNTINSSSATLTFSPENGANPECSNIVFAGLYWTGRAGDSQTVTVDNNGKSKTLDKRQVLIKKGASGTYETVNAISTSITNKNIYFPSGTEDDIYSAYADITSFVQTNKLGEYFVADIATLEGNPDNVGNYGGWGMVVVYENSKMNWRDVTIFDGFAYVKGPQNANYTFEVSGFNTAQSGDLNIKLGVMAGEGDVNVTGNYFQIKRQDDKSFQSLSHSLNSPDNFFNSSINTGGNDRNPNRLNNTGIDIAMFNIDNTGNGIIKNGDTSTWFKYGSTQDTYAIFNVTFSIDAYVPEVTGVITNTYINGSVPNAGNSTIEPGQSAEYKLEIKNVGTEATNNTVITIPLPDTVDPSNLINNLNNFNAYYSTSSDYTVPTYDASLGANGSIVWNLGTLPLPSDPNTVLADITFKLTATTDCSIIGDENSNPTITLYGSIGGTGATSNVTFDTPLIQGYSTDDTCKNNPIPIPIVLNIDNSNFESQPPTITAPSELTIEGCDENNITDLTARYAYTPSQSVDIKDSYVDGTPGYTTSNNITSITYVDVVTPNSSCPLEVTRTYTATNNCGITATAVQTIKVEDNTPPTVATTANSLDVTLECSDASGITAALAQVPTASDDCSTLTLNLVSDVTTPDPDCANAYVRVRTWNFTDGCNNTSDDFVQTIAVSDNTAPTITCPANITISADLGQPNAYITIGLPTVSDNCDTNVTYSNDITGIEDASGTYNLGTTTVTYTATDNCGNSTQCSFTVTVNDEEAPEINCPPTIIVSCINLVPATYANYAEFAAAGGSATDNNGVNEASFTLFSETSDGNTCPETISRVYRISDNEGNTSECTQSIIINDDIDPTIDTNASDLTVECDGSGNASELTTWLANNGGAVASDDCSSVTWSNDFSALSDDCGETGSATVIFTATDGCGNKSTTTATFTIEDKTPPSINTNASNLTVECDGSGNASELTTWLANNGGAVASDDCSGVTWSNDFSALSDDCGETGSAIVIFTATDACGNKSTTTATFTIEDKTPPTIDTTATNIVVECDGSGNNSDIQDWLANNGGASASDNCSGVTWSNNYGNLSSDCSNAIEVIFTATDECGNYATTTATYSIQDTNPPSIDTAASDSTVECDGSGNTTDLNNWLANNGGAIASDNCSAISWSNDFSALSDDCGETGSATVTFTATDGCGNKSTTTATFTIQDTTAPTVPANASSTVQCLKEAIQPNAPVVNDICGGNITPVITAGPDPVCEGDKVYTFTYTDCAGNESVYTYTYNIDLKQFILPANGSETVDNLANAVEPTPPTVTDNCGNVLIPSAPEVTETPDCQGTKKYTYTYTDCAGNTADWTYTYTIILAPFTLPDDGASTVECISDVVVPTPPTVFDANNNEVIPVMTENTDPVCQGDKIYTYTYTDCAGNTDDWVYTYTINDNIAPVAPTAPNPITFECMNDVPSPGNLTAVDNCSGNITVTGVDSADNSNPCNVIITRTWTFTDNCNNTSSVAQVITVADKTAPVAPAAPSDMTYQCIDDVPVAGNLTAVDNCAGNITVAGVDNVDNSNPCNVVITRTWTFTDSCNNSSSASQTITVKDTTAPVLTNNLDTEMDVSCADIPEKPNLTFEDNCSANVDIDYSVTNTFDENTLTDYEIVRTWIVSDACGNKNTYSQTLHVTLDEVVTEVIGEDRCYDDGIIDLNDYLQVANLNGVWEMVEGNQQATLEGNIFNPTTLQLSLDFNPRTDGIPYKFKYTTTDNGCISVTYVSMVIDAKCTVLPCGSEDVVISKAMTPNGDQWNEYFQISGVDLCGFEMDVKIFNRWGALVYKNSNYKNDWNGTSGSGSIGSSGTVPNGTYYYIVILKNSGLNPFTGPVYIGTK